jgi:lipoprotein-anchoring transpeptidase ErfK/SrfK
MKNLFLLMLVVILTTASFGQTYPSFIFEGSIIGPIGEVARDLGIDFHIEKNQAIMTLDQKNFKIEIDKRKVFYLTDENDTPRKVLFAPLRPLAQAFGLNISIKAKNKGFTIDNITYLLDLKLLVLSLSRQRIYAYKGIESVFNCRTCTGKKSTPTKTGVFSVFKKIPGWHYWKATKRVPYSGKMYNAVYFDPPGKAFHGVDDINMRFNPSSHGCARMFCRDADILYPWATIGTMVYVIP